MGQRGQTGTSMIIQRKPINHTKKDCRNCVSYRYDKRFCKNFKIPISMTSTGEVCKNFSNKYATKKMLNPKQKYVKKNKK
jgi:hypothetical protein